MPTSNVTSDIHNGHIESKNSKQSHKKRTRVTISISDQYGEGYVKFMLLIKEDKSKMKWLLDRASDQVEDVSIQESHDQITRCVIKGVLTTTTADLKVTSENTNIYMEFDKSNHESLIKYYLSFKSTIKNKALQDLFYFVYLTLSDGNNEVDQIRNESKSGVDTLNSGPLNNYDDFRSVHVITSENNSDENSLVELCASQYTCEDEDEEQDPFVEELYPRETGSEESDEP